MKKKKNKDTKVLKKKIQKAKRIKRKVATTLDWCQVDSVKNKELKLKKGKTECYAKGIRITPVPIFIKTPRQQATLINNFRIALNKLPMDLYWGFVFTPVAIDDYFTALQAEMKVEEDPVIRNMMQSDFEKGCWFCDSHREIEFELIVTDKNLKEMHKKYDKVVNEMVGAGFQLKEMTDFDYENYLAYVFENELINDYYFSRGIFQCLDDESYIPENGLDYIPNYNPDWEYELEEGEVDERDVQQLQSGM